MISRDVQITGRLVYELDETEVFRMMGWPDGHRPGDLARGVLGEARGWLARNARPWIRLTSIPPHEWVRLGELPAAWLAAGGADGVIVAAASAGHEVDLEAERDWQRGRPDRAYALDRLGAAIVEHLMARVARDALREPCGSTTRLAARWSPGCEDWGLDGQKRLFKILTRADEPRLPGPLTVTDSGALAPRLSQLAVFVIVATGNGRDSAWDPASCTKCTYTPCSHRRPSRPLIDNSMAQRSPGVPA